MKRKLTYVTLILVLAIGCAAPPAGDVADTVYTNGRIYTVDESQPWVEAVGIKDGKFIFVGSASDAAAVTGDATNVVDLGGAFAMPGLIDVHGFHGMSTENRVYCELKGTFWEPTEEQILADLRACAEEYPSEPEWFIAEGFTPGPMSKEALSLATLDAIVPDKPAYVQDESGHNAWVNSHVFEAAGVNAETPDPPAGYFERDASGALTGRVFESAQNPFTELLPVQDLATQKLGNTKFLRQASEKGVTAIGNAYNFERHLAAWQALKIEGELDLHVSLFQNGNFGTAELTPVAEILARYEDFDLPGRPGVKIGIDGRRLSRPNGRRGVGHRARNAERLCRRARRARFPSEDPRHRRPGRAVGDRCSRASHSCGRRQRESPSHRPQQPRQASRRGAAGRPRHPGYHLGRIERPGRV